MKKIITLLTLVFLLTASQLYAKKVKVTIDGIMASYVSKLYLVINEDTANAQLIPLQDKQFSVTVKVDNSAFIRLCETKDWPERAFFVLIPDSKHITVDMRAGSIDGSPMSQRLRQACEQARRAGPNGFHVDVFSDNPDDWKQARETERRIRAELTERQKEVIRQIAAENKNNVIPAWIAYCYANVFEEGIIGIIRGEFPKWLGHPILKNK